MSSTPSAPSEAEPAGPRLPDWFWRFLGKEGPWTGEALLGGQPFVVCNGIPRSLALLSAQQAQTEEVFGFKWKKRDTFESPASLKRMREWLIERYGDVANSGWLREHGRQPLLIDAGCGAGMSALELFNGALPGLRYIGIDVSDAVDVAAERFAEHGHHAGFMQADITNLPFGPATVDLIFSEGVLHHTDSTRGALAALIPLLKRGGRILFYVYRKKGPIREFTDDFIRHRVRSMSPREAWAALEPLTQLGIALGELQAEVEIERPIDILGIPAGRIDVQRLFYWHVAKCYYQPSLSFEEMHHINFDWYAPANAARQSPEEVRAWCAESGLEIEREVIEEAGITIVARRSEP